MPRSDDNTLALFYLHYNALLFSTSDVTLLGLIEICLYAQTTSLLEWLVQYIINCSSIPPLTSWVAAFAHRLCLVKIRIP